MRQELLDPVADMQRLREAVALTSRIYELHDAGHDYTATLAELARLVKGFVAAADIKASEGRVGAEAFARKLLFAAPRTSQTS
jgi:hypothetical protein